MDQISSVDKNQLSPKKKQAKPSQDFDLLGQRVKVSSQTTGTSGHEDRVELSPEALKILKESRAKAKQNSET